LPAEDRAKAAILPKNYGEAGAIDFFGPPLGLPRALSGHQNYWYWGPRDYTGDVIIALQHMPRPPSTAARAVAEPEALELISLQSTPRF